MCHPAWRQALIAAQRLRDLARLRRVRNRIDREYARPLDVEALARDGACRPDSSADGSVTRTASRRTPV